MISGLNAVMAAPMGLLDAYKTASELFVNSSFDQDEIAVLWQSVNVDDNVVQAFLGAGLTQRQILEVILGVSQKVMSNYTNHLANTPVDAAFRKFDWQTAA